MEKGKLFEIVLLGTLLSLLAIAVLIIYNGADDGRSQWKFSMNSTPYMYVEDDNQLFVFENNDIYAIRPDGSLEWKTTIPANWSVISDWDIASIFVPDADGTGLLGHGARSGSGPVFAAGNDTVYLYLRSNQSGYENQAAPDMLAAIKNGSLLWAKELPIKSDPRMWGPSVYPGLEVREPRIYLFDKYNVTVFDTEGAMLYTIPDVSDPPAIDEAGNLYLVEARWPDWQNSEKISYASPSRTVKAYSPDGSLLWNRTINDTAARRELQGGSIAGVYPLSQSTIVSLPVYTNHTLFVPIADGLTAIDPNGSVRWTVHLGLNVTLTGDVPFDSLGNFYMTVRGYSWELCFDHNLESWRYVYVIAPDGNYSITDPHHFYPIDEKRMLGLEDGIGYYSMSPIFDRDLPGPGIILPANLTAVDLRSGEDIWTFDVTIGRPEVLVVDETNVDSLFADWGSAENIREDNKNHPDMKDNTSRTYAYYGETEITVLPADNVVYVGYYGYSYDYPVFDNHIVDMWDLANSAPMHSFPPVFNKTRFYYTGGLCAIDRNNGTLLWQKPTGSFVTGMTANNSTLYYSTKNGGLTGVTLVAGMTAVAAALLFIHVFVFGAVSRARSRLEQNENRLAILQLVKERPGSTMYEISRELGMNLGTMRYHLLILGINHKIREHKDGKYVRFFPGSQVFTDIELEVMSLLRREPIRRLMGVLCEKPGISNSEIACALGISESAVSNYMRELSTKGLVTKEVTAAGRVAYMIRKEHAEKIENVLASTG